MSKDNLIIYTGHCETVGGDARYFFDLTTGVDKSKFNTYNYTDINKMFEVRVDQWTTGNIEIDYVDTVPRLFTSDPFRSKVDKFLPLKGNKVVDIFARLITKFLKAILFYELVNEVKNYKLFKSRLKNLPKDSVFHFNNGGYPGKRAGITAIVAAKMLGIKKTVMTIQNMPSGKSWYRLFDHLVDFIIKKYCDCLICPSETLKSDIVKWRGLDSDFIKVIHHGVDYIEELKEGEEEKIKDSLEIKSNELVFLIIGHLDEVRKGHVELFDALSRVKGQLPAYKLLVVGSGERLEYLKSYTKEVGIESSVNFLGYRDDLRELNLIADIILQPSTGFEGVPYSIRDGMRAKKPIIASSIGGIKEAVFDNENGFLLTGGDIDQLSAAIVKLSNSQELRERMGKRSLEIFEEKFLLSTMVKKHEDLYQSLLTEGN